MSAWPSFEKSSKREHSAQWSIPWQPKSKLKEIARTPKKHRPKTPEDKTILSGNAVTHGQTAARADVLPDEQEAFDYFADVLREQWLALDELEKFYVDHHRLRLASPTCQPWKRASSWRYAKNSAKRKHIRRRQQQPQRNARPRLSSGNHFPRETLAP
jgi:hypothetical protein